jgi:hypothetical protein
MKKSSFLLPTTLILVGVIVGGLLVASLLTQATKKIHEGDSFLYSGKVSRAIESYELAQKLWPFLYSDSQLNQKIQQAKEVKGWIESAPALTIFFRGQASESEIQTLQQEIKSITGVKEVKYVSRENAFQIYAEKNKDNPDLVKMISPDLFPASLEVYLNDSSIIEKISQVAKGKSIVAEVVKSTSLE